MNLLTRLLFPPKCSACDALLPPDTPTQEALCPDCQKLWESEKAQTCGVCARPVGKCLCMTERMKQAKCRGHLKLCYYLPRQRAPVQNRMIFRMKRSRDRATIAFLTDALEKRLLSYLKDEEILGEKLLLTYVPRGTRALLLHGTDQARVLATALSERMGIELRHLLRRRRLGGKTQQKRLGATKRFENAKRAFEIDPRKDPSLAGRYVILVDDIVTTGAGMAACAQKLRQAGARTVLSCVIATVPDKRKEKVTK